MRIGGRTITVKIETLDSLFNGRKPGYVKQFKSACSRCGREAVIDITKTSSGYGFFGGIIHEPFTTGALLLSCGDCCRSV